MNYREMMKAMRSPPLMLVILSSVSVTLNFGVPSTWTGIITTLAFATLILWIADRVFNVMVRGQNVVKGVYMCLTIAIILMLFAWGFAYLATLYPDYELILMGIWFLLALVVIKFNFFGEEDYELKAWTQAAVFTLVVGVATVIGMWVASLLVLALEMAGLSQVYASALTTGLFVVLVVILLWVDRKRAYEMGETLRETGRNLVDPNEWVGEKEHWH